MKNINERGMEKSYKLGKIPDDAGLAPTTERTLSPPGFINPPCEEKAKRKENRRVM
jgi:hypothetical protein